MNRYIITAIIGICVVLVVVIVFFLKNMHGGNDIRYSVIGDSYSNGEGASYDESWPSLLTNHLKRQGVAIALVSNPSITGWTSQQAIDEELPEYNNSHPTFATLQIGVNDWVQGVDVHTFTRNLSLLINAMQKKLPDKHKLVLVTIPDFSVTPVGERYSEGRNISQGIQQFNTIIMSEGKKRGLLVIDIFPLSQHMKDNKSLIANDGLHPSAKEYALWQQVIYSLVHTLFTQK